MLLLPLAIFIFPLLSVGNAFHDLEWGYTSQSPSYDRFVFNPVSHCRNVEREMPLNSSIIQVSLMEADIATTVKGYKCMIERVMKLNFNSVNYYNGGSEFKTHNEVRKNLEVTKEECIKMIEYNTCPRTGDALNSKMDDKVHRNDFTEDPEPATWWDPTTNIVKTVCTYIELSGILVEGDDGKPAVLFMGHTSTPISPGSFTTTDSKAVIVVREGEVLACPLKTLKVISGTRYLGHNTDYFISNESQVLLSFKDAQILHKDCNHRTGSHTYLDPSGQIYRTDASLNATRALKGEASILSQALKYSTSSEINAKLNFFIHNNDQQERMHTKITEGVLCDFQDEIQKSIIGNLKEEPDSFLSLITNSNLTRGHLIGDNALYFKLEKAYHIKPIPDPDFTQDCMYFIPVTFHDGTSQVSRAGYLDYKRRMIYLPGQYPPQRSSDACTEVIGLALNFPKDKCIYHPATGCSNRTFDIVPIQVFKSIKLSIVEHTIFFNSNLGFRYFSVNGLMQIVNKMLSTSATQYYDDNFTKQGISWEQVQVEGNHQTSIFVYIMLYLRDGWIELCHSYIVPISVPIIVLYLIMYPHFRRIKHFLNMKKNALSQRVQMYVHKPPIFGSSSENESMM